MSSELCIPLTMKAVASGCPLDRARRLADAIVLQLVLLCMLLGYRMVRPDETGWPEERAFFRACQVSSRDLCGIFPVVPGTGAGRCSRTLLHS